MDASITRKINPQDFLDELASNKLNFYVTYEKSFLSAKLVDQMQSSITSLANSSMPVMAASIAQNIIANKSIGIVADYTAGGYSFTPTTTVSDVNVPEYQEHYYNTNDSLNPYKSITVPAHTVTFQANNKYTVQNEEYRAALLSTSALPNGELRDKLSSVNLNNGSYAVPSIEGVTVIETTIDATND
jgi:hypothetical protein